MHIVIPGPPRTKKTGNRIVSAGVRKRIIPSKAHEAWFASAMSHAFAIKAELRKTCVLPVDDYVTVKARFYLDLLNFAQPGVGDLAGYIQAFGDLLEAAQIITNDKNILSWDGSRVCFDLANPRIEADVLIITGDWRYD